jgi:predicted permease
MRRPGFAGAAILTLTLGIGANTAIFSLVHGSVLRPLDYVNPDRIVSVWPSMWFSKDLFRRMQDGARSFSVVSVYSQNGYILTGQGTSEFLQGPLVSADFFSVLGVRPVLGRTFVAGEDQPGAEPVVVISYGFWRRVFAGRPDVLDRTLELDGTAHRIVGVMPAGFDFLQAGADVSVPLSVDPSGSDYSRARYLKGVARLGDEVTLSQAAQDIARLAEQWQREFTWSDRFVQSATVTPLHDVIVGPVRARMYLLLGAVGLMFLVACANVANLLIARGLGRRKEMAVRRALGASRARIVRQLMVEGGLLGVLGGLGGVVVAVLAVRALRALLPADTPRIAAVGVNGITLAVACGLSILACLLFALAPAAQAVRGSLRAALPTGGAAAAVGPRGTQLRRALVLAETVLAATLLIGAGLMAKSLWRLQHVDLGFDPANKVGFHLVPRETDYEGEGRAAQLHQRVSERLAQLPGVSGAAAIHSPPVIGGGWNTGIEVEGADVAPDDLPFSFWRVVTPSYFETLGIPLMRGRYLREEDHGGAPAVVVVNRAAANVLWPNEDPVGRRMRFGFESNDDWLTVVGIIGDVRNQGADVAPQPTVYRALAQAYPSLEQVGSISMWHVVSTANPDVDVTAAIRSAVGEMEPNAVVARLAPLPVSISGTLAEPRSTAILLVVFAVSSVALGAVGLFGLMAYRVGERTREIGLRMAMGAAAPRILRLIVAEGAGLALAGVAVGLGVSFLAGRAMQGLLFQVQPRDPVVFAVVGTVLVVVALLATYLPAHRAALIDPVKALRSE